MLIFDLHNIGNNLYKIRKSKGLTQAEVAEMAELSDRTYADIERGSVTMRVDSLLKICTALNITPNDILVSDNVIEITEQDIAETIKGCSNNEKITALKLLGVYIDSLK
ncbi:MAG: helix-turn-helix transcriptional regulator [Oscillospiraceae bacterium]|nr:helix-turn-helix transcriptional regulator [Oscillospiraceae bacterium]